MWNKWVLVDVRYFGDLRFRDDSHKLNLTGRFDEVCVTFHVFNIISVTDLLFNLGRHYAELASERL